MTSGGASRAALAIGDPRWRSGRGGRGGKQRPGSGSDGWRG